MSKITFHKSYFESSECSIDLPDCEPFLLLLLVSINSETNPIKYFYLSSDSNYRV